LTRRGKSHSRRPISKRAPAWCKYGPEEVEAFVIKLAKEGNTQSKIGVILRDQYGIPLVKPIVGKSVGEIVDKAGVKADIPEDLSNMVQKATIIQRHLAKNKSDSLNKRSAELIVSKVNRSAKYYRSNGELPAEWKYKPKPIGLV
jgi:small subunit ribosomal protein S15